VWNPSNCEVWVLQKIEGKGTYELSGRWRCSPYGGSFVNVKFGENKTEPMYEHMKRPLISRAVTPGAPDALQSVQMAHMRDLPGPVRNPNRRQTPKRNRALLAGEAVLRYWAKDRSNIEGQNPTGQVVAWKKGPSSSDDVSEEKFREEKLKADSLAFRRLFGEKP